MYSCDKCDFATTHSRSLRRHIKCKYEEVIYSCTHCEFAATTARYI